MTKTYDPDLIYVECGKCGQPILWGPGQTKKILDAAEIADEEIDEHCAIISDGCPSCKPGETSFSTQIVRMNDEQEDTMPEGAEAH